MTIKCECTATPSGDKFLLVCPNCNQPAVLAKFPRLNRACIHNPVADDGFGLGDLVAACLAFMGLGKLYSGCPDCPRRRRWLNKVRLRSGRKRKSPAGGPGTAAE